MSVNRETDRTRLASEPRMMSVIENRPVGRQQPHSARCNTCCVIPCPLSFDTSDAELCGALKSGLTKRFVTIGYRLLPCVSGKAGVPLGGMCRHKPVHKHLLLGPSLPWLSLTPRCEGVVGLGVPGSWGSDSRHPHS